MDTLIMLQLKVALQLAMKEEVSFRKEGLLTSTACEYSIAQKTVSRAIISMCPEIGKKPGDVTNDDTIKLLKKYINQEKERNLYQFGYLKEADIEGKSGPEVKKLVADTIRDCGDSLTSTVIEIAQGYLPKQATEDEIVKWISENIDFTKFKNKMQAMGPIMKQFKGSNGNVVKSILLNL